jgi:glucose/arabinose dehydrogenase
VVERGGRIWALQADRRELLLDVSDRMRVRSEEGLLGVAFHPGYGENGRFFVHHTDLEGAMNLVEYRVSDDPAEADPASRREVLQIPQPASNHNGRMVAFGPDGMLYLALGDGGGQGDAFGHGQRPDTPHGAILRVDVDGDQPYAVSRDNPFASGQRGAPEGGTTACATRGVSPSTGTCSISPRPGPGRPCSSCRLRSPA